MQYMGLPDHDWDKLRKAHPWVYENQVNPVPDANDWFHATIVLKDDSSTPHAFGFNNLFKSTRTFRLTSRTPLGGVTHFADYGFARLF